VILAYLGWVATWWAIDRLTTIVHLRSRRTQRAI
jgi:hypothetical protein